MDLIWHYKSIIFAGLVAVVYLFVVRPRLKAGARAKDPEVPVYVCDDCGETDCVCHKVEDDEKR